jgi:hypothetical protein
MVREFKELTLDEHNYPTCALDVKISLTFRGILSALSPRADREVIFFRYIQVPSIIHHPKTPSPT